MNTSIKTEFLPNREHEVKCTHSKAKGGMSFEKMSGNESKPPTYISYINGERIIGIFDKVVQDLEFKSWHDNNRGNMEFKAYSIDVKNSAGYPLFEIIKGIGDELLIRMYRKGILIPISLLKDGIEKQRQGII